jgi:hypothetical protein
MATFTAIGRLLRQIVIQYKAFKIGGSAIPMFMEGCRVDGSLRLPASSEDIRDDEGSRGARVAAGERVGGQKMWKYSYGSCFVLTLI